MITIKLFNEVTRDYSLSEYDEKIVSNLCERLKELNSYEINDEDKM